MHIRSLQAWKGFLIAAARPVLAGLVMLLAVACSQSNNSSSTTTVTVTKQVINGFTATPTTIAQGQSCTLIWSVTSAYDSTGVTVATTLSIDQGVGSVTGLPKISIHPTATTTYILTATSSAGSVTLSQTVTVVPPVNGNLSLFAGVAHGAANVDGPIAGAGFSYPSDVAQDGQGNIYITDSSNHTIRKISTAGDVSTFAGIPGQSGFADGSGSLITFNNPSSLALDADGNLFVADTGNNTIRKITAAGVSSTIAGKADAIAGSSNGKGSVARFNSPFGLALDAAGNVYVADSYNDTIRKLTPTPKATGGVDYYVSTLAGATSQTGATDDTGNKARFTEPTGLAADANGNVYVADSGNSTIRKITPDGVVTTLAGTAGLTGSVDAKGSEARFNQPYKLSVDGSGNVYVADMGNSTIRMITPDGTVSTLAGTAGESGDLDGIGSAARFSVPNAVAVDGSGNVFVADSGNKTIRKIDSGMTVTTIAGISSSIGSTDGSAFLARFNDPGIAAVDKDGNIYVADTGNSTIRKITPGGVVSTLAGTAGVTGHADATGPAARFKNPEGVAVDGAGNVYVADTGNDTIRKITPAGVVSTLAGTAGSSGTTDATGAAARFNAPTGLTVDGSGNVFVADYGNHTIRKITPGGVVTTYAGTAGTAGSTNATGTSAMFYHPHGLAVDASGNLFVADMDNHVIRKVTPEKLVTVLAGVAGTAGYLDDVNATAEFYWPCATAVDSSGHVYVADFGNNAIRRITPNSSSTTTDGAVITIAGTEGKKLNATGPLPSSLDRPAGIALDPTTGNMFITIQNAVLKITF